MERNTYKDGKLSKKQKELIAIGILVVINCESCMEWHIKQAACNLKYIICLFVFFVLCIDKAHTQFLQADISIYAEDTLTISAFRTGVTHTQYSLDPWGNQAAIDNARILLENSTCFQNQHIMAWGAGNPWPDSAVVDESDWEWESLDRRIDLIRETNGTPVITFCACPTWMHTPSKNGTTDWEAIETAPTPAHYNKFAHLCAGVARRYPDVEYFQVWNELKGFYLASENRWDYESYTLMYNIIYDSVKAVNGDAKIGGPYITMDSWSTDLISHPSELEGEYGVIDQRPLDVISYWLEHKHGAELLTVDGGTMNKDSIWITDAFTAAQKYVDIISWIRQQEWGSDTLPVWWCEWYSYPADNAQQDDLTLNNAVMASCMIETIKAGYANAMIWQPQGDSEGCSFPLGIWTDTQITGGGQPTLYYYTQKAFMDFFSKGAVIFNTASSTEDVSVFASEHNTLLVNHLDEPVYVTVNDDVSTILDAYEVQLSENFNQAKDKLSENEIIIFPNPASGYLTIVNAGNNNSEIICELYNSYGQHLKAYTVHEYLPGNKEIILNIDNLDPGIYLCRFKSGNTSFCKHIVKAE